ncbi:fungal specific transcription factor domain-containing protein [Colletotrichum graminicola]|nr:fungal specific transcription factor domain-containing protein [Colletotrichum graminicola]
MVGHNAKPHGIRVASPVWATTTYSPPSEIASPAAKPSEIGWQNQELSNDEPVHFNQNRAILRVMLLAERCLKRSIELLLDANPHHRHDGTWFTARATMARALRSWPQSKARAASVLQDLIGQVIGAGG